MNFLLSSGGGQKLTSCFQLLLSSLPCRDRLQPGTVTYNDLFPIKLCGPGCPVPETGRVTQTLNDLTE